jgi:hypothetical protein
MHSFRPAQIEDVSRLKASMRHIHFRHSPWAKAIGFFISMTRCAPLLIRVLQFLQKRIVLMAPEGAISMEPMDVFYGTICLLLTRYP